MASCWAAGRIADRVGQSLSAFESLEKIEAPNDPEGSRVIYIQEISDQQSKFKIWAGNIGAHRTGRSSLDYRLRDSSHLHTQVMRILDDLVFSLNEAHSILTGESVPWDEDFGEMGELDEELMDLLSKEEFDFDTQLSQLTEEIGGIIGNLLRLSISLRNPAPHDHFMSTEYATVRYFEPSDIAHVEAKFPQASQSVTIRIGQALSRKRQYFKYRESHHEQLAHGLFGSGGFEDDARGAGASSLPPTMRDPGSPPGFGELDKDEGSATGFSQTSLATTAPDSERLRIPPLPKRSYNNPFECPFCFMLISVSTPYQWKKHVLSDLQPYTCMADDCPAANRDYARQHEWINHMLQKHWRTWKCPYQCPLNDASETNLRHHITSTHGSKTELELDAIIARCSRTRTPSRSSPTNCPLCQEKIESVQKYQKHVGRHLVDLSLFALPSLDNDEEINKQNMSRVRYHTEHPTMDVFREEYFSTSD